MRLFDRYKIYMGCCLWILLVNSYLKKKSLEKELYDDFNKLYMDDIVSNEVDTGYRVTVMLGEV